MELTVNVDDNSAGKADELKHRIQRALVQSAADGSTIALYAQRKASGQLNCETALAFAEVFLQRGHRKLGSHCVDMAIQNAKTTDHHVLISLFLRDKARQPDTALKILTSRVRSDPDDALLWDAIAETHRAAGAERQLIEDSYLAFKRSGARNGKGVARAFTTFGELLNDKGNYVLAEQAYRAALDSDPNAVLVLSKLSSLLRRRFGRYNEAETLILHSVKVDPSKAWSWYHLGYMYHYSLRRFPEALSAYRQALKIDPTYTRVWACLALLLAWEIEDFVGAEDAFCKAISLGDAEAYVYNHYGISFVSVPIVTSMRKRH